MSSIRQAAVIMPPERSNAGTPQATVTTPVGAASTVAIDSGIDSANAKCTKNWITIDTDQDIYICFGASDMAAATSSDWRLNAIDGPVSFLLDSRRTRFWRAIRVTADAVVKTYISG